MAKNHYATVLKNKHDEDCTTWFGWGIQVAFDALTIAMSEPAVMGKDTFGEERLNRINGYAAEVQREIVRGFFDRTKGSYIRADIDRRLQQICKNSFCPWNERFPGFNDRGI